MCSISQSTGTVFHSTTKDSLCYRFQASIISHQDRMICEKFMLLDTYDWSLVDGTVKTCLSKLFAYLWCIITAMYWIVCFCFIFCSECPWHIEMAFCLWISYHMWKCWKITTNYLNVYTNLLFSVHDMKLNFIRLLEFHAMEINQSDWSWIQ